MPLAVLVAVNYVNLITGPGYLIFLGQGILRPGVLSAVVGMAVNVVATATPARRSAHSPVGRPLPGRSRDPHSTRTIRVEPRRSYIITSGRLVAS